MARAFAGMGGVDVTNKNPYFDADERYRVEVEKCEHVTSQDGREFFVIEAKILETTSARLKVGTVCSQVILIPGQHRMGLRNVKGFLAAANGIDPTDKVAMEENLGMAEDGTDLGMEAAMFAVSSENPLKGVIVDLQTTETITKKGTPFTVHTWRPVADE